ncbi:MAG: TatD family hydrolase [Candidatus Thermoplasmatota archaeon]|nr:TatD family hydrolase [Candidatus Thermoplasmatota archaeon]
MFEDGVWTGPIFDQHIHLDRRHRFLGAVSDFVKFGGTGMLLVHKPAFSESLPVNADEYNDAYLDTISMANEVRDSFGIDVGVALGQHPVAWEKQIETLGLEASTELHLSAVGLAMEYIDSGEAHCLGEVGRPHYPVEASTWEAANDNLLEIMSMASSEGVTIQLHVEENGPTTCRELSEMCNKSNFPIDRAIRHFAPPNISSEFTSNLPATVSVGKGSIDQLASSLNDSDAPWGMETDFLDDPKRPGAVLGPKTVPKRTQELCSRLLADGWTEEKVEGLMLKIHHEWPKSLYGDFGSE